MMSFGGAPMSFLGISKSQRRDRYASAPRLWVMSADVRPPRQIGTLRYDRATVRTIRQNGTLRYVGCDLVLLVMGHFMLFGGFVVAGFLGFAPEEVVPSRFRPVAAVPAAVMVAGIICIAVATVSANRKAKHRNDNSRVAPRQAQSARIQSFAATTDTGSVPHSSGGRSSGSDYVRCTRSPQATCNNTRTAFVNRASGCAPTIHLVQCSGNAPPSYETVMENTNGCTRF